MFHGAHRPRSTQFRSVAAQIWVARLASRPSCGCGLNRAGGPLPAPSPSRRTECKTLILLRIAAAFAVRTQRYRTPAQGRRTDAALSRSVVAGRRDRSAIGRAPHSRPPAAQRQMGVLDKRRRKFRSVAPSLAALERPEVTAGRGRAGWTRPGRVDGRRGGRRGPGRRAGPYPARWPGCPDERRASRWRRPGALAGPTGLADCPARGTRGAKSRSVGSSTSDRAVLGRERRAG